MCKYGGAAIPNSGPSVCPLHNEFIKSETGWEKIRKLKYGLAMPNNANTGEGPKTC